MAYGKGKVCSGKGQRTPVKWQRENFVAHGKLCRSQATRKLTSRQVKTLGKWQGKPSSTANGKLPWSTTNGKFVEAGQRKVPS